jgi:hypothetical protein
MAITKLPLAPTPTDTTAEFNAKSFAFVAALNGFVTEANALETMVSTAGRAVALDATTASVASSAAVSAANYKGEWSLLRGALAVPASASHVNKVWVLRQAVSDVKEEEPGVSSKWLSTTDLSSPGPIGELTQDTAQFRTIRVSGSESELSSRLPNIKEVVTITAVAATGSIDFDLTRQSVVYSTVNATSHWGLNFRGSESASLNSMMAVGEVVSATFIVAQGAPAFFNNAVKVDGQAVIPKWIGGAPTAGNVNGLDSYSFALIKHGEANFTVLASLTQFK